MFLKRGRKHALNVAGNSLKAVEDKLRDVSATTPPDTGELSARLRDVESELARLNDERKAQGVRLDRAKPAT